MLQKIDFGIVIMQTILIFAVANVAQSTKLCCDLIAS